MSLEGIVKRCFENACQMGIFVSLRFGLELVK